MSRDEITALFARRAEAWSRHDAAALTADHSEDATADSPIQGRLVGRPRIQQVYESWFKSFKDLSYTPLDLLIDDNRVAQFFCIQGTQSAPFGGVPATGRHIELRGVSLFTLGPDGLITHDRRFYDVTSVLVQLGVLKGKTA